MNSTSFTTRPLLSTIVVSANPQRNSRMLDELLVTNKRNRLALIPPGIQLMSGWLSESTILGVDSANQPMYSLTKSEILIIATWAVLDLTALGVLITWLIN